MSLEPGELLLRVVRDRVPSLRPYRGLWRGDCPWCDDADEFFLYLPDIYYCFACGDGGFTSAKEWLAKERGLQ